MSRVASVLGIVSVLWPWSGADLSAQTPKQVSQLVAKCNRSDETSCRQLVEDYAALERNRHPLDVPTSPIDKLTNQQALLRIVLQTNHVLVLQHALAKITDPLVLASIAHTTLPLTQEKRLAATKRLTDQAVLAAIVSNEQDEYVRMEALRRITDHATLVRLAEESKHPDVRTYATDRITAYRLREDLPDQTELARIAAATSGDKENRARAIAKLTDQPALAEIALNDLDVPIKLAAVRRLTDQTLLTKVVEKLRASDWYREVTAEAISLMGRSNPTLRTLANITGGNDKDAFRAFARISLAIQEPLISARFPRLALRLKLVVLYRQYKTREMFNPVNLHGEEITISMRQDAGVLASKTWTATFPQTTTWGSTYFYAAVESDELLGEFLRQPVFTQDDLATIAASAILDLRLAAVANLTNETLLTRLAADEKEDQRVRLAASSRLSSIMPKKQM